MLNHAILVFRRGTEHTNMAIQVVRQDRGSGLLARTPEIL